MVQFILDAAPKTPLISEIFAFILSLVGAGAPIGLWIKWQIDKSRARMEREAERKEQKTEHVQLVERIEKSDIMQTAQISEIQADIISLKEITKSASDIARMKAKINRVYDHNLAAFDFDNEELVLTLHFAKQKAIEIYSTVLTDNFEHSGQDLAKMIENSLKSVKRNLKLQKLNPKNPEFIKSLSNELRMELRSFIVGYMQIVELQNGERREKFIELSASFFQKCLMLTYANY